jgi:flagellar hook protein FlgE
MSIFGIGLSGLSAASDDLDSISQNIANSSTTGYKSETTTFAASYSGSQATGVSVAATTQSFDNDGDLVETDDDLDVAISGSGFFVLSDGTSTTYTRAGDFSMDSDYNIVSSSGKNLQGYSADADGNISYGALTDLSVDPTIAAKASSTITLTANLNADATAIDTTTNAFDSSDSSTYNYSISSEVYDSLGSSHTLTQYYVNTDDNTWNVYYSLDGTTLDTAQYSTSLTFDSDGALTSVSYTNAGVTRHVRYQPVRIQLQFNQ